MRKYQFVTALFGHPLFGITLRHAKIVEIGAKQKKAPKKKVAATTTTMDGEVKEDNFIPDIDKAMRREDKLPTKTKPQYVEKIH